MIDQTAIAAAIESLKMMRELMLFDPSTGEDIRVESLNKDNKDLYDAAHTALACMRECAERREGCEYCGMPGTTLYVVECTEPRIMMHISGRYLQMYDEEYPGWVDHLPIRFCPMCGRKLDGGDT